MHNATTAPSTARVDAPQPGDQANITIPVKSFQNIVKWLSRAEKRHGNRDVSASLAVLAEYMPEGHSVPQ